MNAERAAGWVRRWVALYTRGLPAEIRQERRDEIDSDLWSQLHDAAESAHREESLASEIVARLVFGIPADLSWRLEQRQVTRNPVARELNPTTGTRAIAAMAIIGGVAWTIWPIPQGLVGRDWTAEVAGLLMLSVVGGTWVLGGATLGLVTEFQDRVRTRAAVFGTLGALLGIVSVLGLFGAIVALPLGTAALVWDLGRAGVLGPRLARAHVVAGVIFPIALAVFLGNSTLIDDPATAVPLLLLAATPYAFSWIAIGWSLRRGAPMPLPEPQRPRS